LESFDDEIDAFRAFARMFPGNSTLLVDTYDTLSGVRKAAVVGNEMAARGQRLSGVRLDSGDLFALSQATRAILDTAGLLETRIFASGGLNEYKVADLVTRGAPIDAFGVGTDMGVSGDAPWLDCAYKLVEYAGRPRLKLSSKKETLVGRKQVWRAVDAAGGLRADCVGLRDETADVIAAQLDAAPASVQPHLCQVMRGGVVSAASPSLDGIRARFREDFLKLPDAYKALRQPPQYPVRISGALRHAQDVAAAAVRARIRG